MAVFAQTCVVVLLFLCHVTSAVYFPRRCPPHHQIKCHKPCHSGYATRKDWNGCQYQTCQCRNPCEHRDCGLEKECEAKTLCLWGTEICFHYPVCKPKLIVPKCGYGQPLIGVSCGRGPSHHTCPFSHHCVVDHADRWAVCCPKETPTPTEAAAHNLPKCEQPSLAGPCTDWKTRYVFNKLSGHCQMFLYGGCQGNDNNFLSERDCLKACVGPDHTYCTLPPETGMCRAYIPSFYYNSKTGNCEEFIYGGCGGNGNRFRTQAQCEQYCPRRAVRFESPYRKLGIDKN